MYGGIISIIPHGMVWYGTECYVNKHMHKENLGTFASVLERLDSFRKRLNAFQALWDLMGAFGRLGRRGGIIPYVLCIVYE